MNLCAPSALALTPSPVSLTDGQVLGPVKTVVWADVSSGGDSHLVGGIGDCFNGRSQGKYRELPHTVVPTHPLHVHVRREMHSMYSVAIPPGHRRGKRQDPMHGQPTEGPVDAECIASHPMRARGADSDSLAFHATHAHQHGTSGTRSRERFPPICARARPRLVYLPVP